MKVLFLTNLPSPYRVAFFNELGKLCDLTVLYERKTADNRNEKWVGHTAESFKEIYLKGRHCGEEGAYCPEVRKYLRDKTYTHIIISGYGTPTSMFTIIWLKMHKKRFIITSDGGMMKENSGLKFRIKKFFISSANMWLTTSLAAKNYLIHYGAKESKCYIYPFTSLTESDLLQIPPVADEKTRLRAVLGMTEEKIILSVGRFSYLGGYGKGYDVLLKAARQLPKNLGFYIVGDEPTAEFIKMREDMHLSNVHFVGFKGRDDLKKYYMASDLFVLMTIGDVWGLVINEAMACGLPVITTDKCVAGLELVENGVNGYIVSVGDEQSLIKKIRTMIEDAGILTEMGGNSLKKIEKYTINEMVKNHYTILHMLSNDETIYDYSN
jgi:glycosyltransferase involved in cell wall biosynthesis